MTIWKVCIVYFDWTSEMSVMHAYQFHLTNVDCDAKLDKLQQKIHKCIVFGYLDVCMHSTRLLFYCERSAVWIDVDGTTEFKFKSKSTRNMCQSEEKRVKKRLRVNHTMTKKSGLCVAAVMLLLRQPLILIYHIWYMFIHCISFHFNSIEPLCLKAWDIWINT